jgi:hypothetical protein
MPRLVLIILLALSACSGDTLSGTGGSKGDDHIQLGMPF